MEARIDNHPPIDSLNAFGLGLLGDASAQSLFLHLEDCPPCRRRAEESSGDDFLARLQKARAANSTPAPPRQLPPLSGMAQASGHSSTLPPDPAKSLASSIFDAKPDETPARASIPNDIPPELVANPQYEVIRELGRGGMGVVYLARNKQMDRLEVLKVVNRNLLDRPGTVDRFLREIRSAAALEHKNVVRAYACLQAGKLLALVMEYVEGEDLAHLVERRGPLSVASACASIVQAARGLQEAHAKGMVHRDIKPQNLLLSHKLKEVLILDFGLAKVASEKGVEQGLTAVGKMLGTPGYVAPEQIRDAASADIRADIYSLGCTLYYLLSGHPPFDAPNLYALLHAHQHVEADPLHEERPNVPPALTAVVARMMAKEPAARYQKPADVAAALAPFVKGGKAAAPAPVRPKPAKQEAMVTASVPPPLPAHVQVELVPPPVVEHAPFDLEDAPTPAVSKKRKKGNGKFIPMALLLLLPLGAWLASVILRVETPNGTLIVEIKDDEVEAKIKGGKLILTGPDGKVRYTLSAKERNKKLDAGPYTIRVQGADGLALDTEEFTIKKGDKVTVKVMLEPKAVPAGTDTAMAPKEIVKEKPRSLDPDPRRFDPDPKPDDKGFVSLFNGKDLKGWQTEPIKNRQGHNSGTKDFGAWFVKDGILTGRNNSFACLRSERDDYSDFHIRVEAMVDGAGGAVVFRFPAKGAPGPFLAPVASTGRWQTGSLIRKTIRILECPHWSIKDVPPSPALANTWIVLDVIAVGDHITIKVNDTTTADVRQPDGERSGALMLYAEGGTGIQFRKVEIKELPGTKTVDIITQPQASLDPDRKAAQWWQSIGGSIFAGEKGPGKQGFCSPGAKLPAEPFWLTGIAIESTTKANDEGLALFKDCKNLTHINLLDKTAGDAILAHFKDCKELKTLMLRGTKVSDAGLASFKSCKNLTYLDLSETQVGDAGMAHLEGCTNLTSLKLKRTKVTAARIAELKKELPACKIEWDGVIVPKAALDADRKAAEWVLSIGGWVRVNGQFDAPLIKTAPELPPEAFKLTQVWLTANKKVTDGDLSAFKGCQNLTFLSLNMTPVTDAGLAYFKECKSLTTLDLNYTKVGDAGLANFKDCKSLTSLNLDGTKVGDAGLANFKDCKSLTRLELAGTKVSNAGLVNFKDCTSLTYLGLNGTKVGDRGVAHFKGCKSLTSLCLWNTQFSDAGLVYFKDCKTLTVLQVRGSRVTAAKIKAFQMALPMCKIQ